MSGQCEQVTVSSVFSLDAAPCLGTLCGSASGSTRVSGFSNSRSFCHSPSEVAYLPTGAIPAQWVHRCFSLVGGDRHNDLLAPCDKLGVHSARTPEWHSW